MTVPLVTAENTFSSLAQQMGRWVEHVLGSDYQKYRPDQTWRPAIDLYEDESSYYMVADLGGVDPKTIDLHVEKGKLLVRGDRRAPRPPGRQECPRPDPGLRLHLMEINQGPFLRVLQLSESVDTEKICACYKSGFLWVKMPKKS